MDNIKTQVKIIEVASENIDFCNIEADIPGFNSLYPITWIKWANRQGKAPDKGTEGVAELRATTRRKRFIKKGEISEGPPDGSEKPWMNYWEMLSFEPLTGGKGNNGSVAPNKDTKAVNGLSGATKAVFLDANERYRVDKRLYIAEKAMWMVITHGANSDGGGSLYADMEAVVKESLVVRKALEGILEQEGLGRPPAIVPTIRNSEELRDFVKKKGWKMELVKEAIRNAGFEDSDAYLESAENNAQGLAQLLQDAIGD